MPPAPERFRGCWILTGPTGSGKSAAALEIAGRIGGEILALDSMTLYRGLDIGTAKPSRAEQARVPHHLIDLLDPWESANVAWWLDRAAEAVDDIRARGKRPIFVGGTPFYLKALLHGLFDAPPANDTIRARWEAEAERIGREALHARLQGIDPVAAARLHFNDVRRVVRALEVFEATGRPISSFQQTWETPAFPIPTVALEWPTEELNRRIDARVVRMAEAGWLEETLRLQALPKPLGREASQALGYREWLAHARGEASAAETIALIQLRTRQFAKRQRTWFRGLPNLRQVPAGGDSTAEILNAWQEEARAGANASGRG
jgi:tRNA dimethylallyltransferase